MPPEVVRSVTVTIKIEIDTNKQNYRFNNSADNLEDAEDLFEEAQDFLDGFD